MSCPSFLRASWAEINLDNLVFNLEAFRRRIDPGIKIMAVVKADGYGHGAVEVARVAVEKGCDYLGVGFLDEGIELRKAGIEAPVLILGHTPPEQVREVLDYQLVPTVFSLELAEALDREARGRGQRARIHVKVDTGMGRLGIFPWEEGRSFLEKVSHMPGLELEGLFTHFASADERDKARTRQQVARFQDLVLSLSRRGLRVPLKHAANSAAAIDMPETNLDMVRLGIGIYGLYPSSQVQAARVPLRPLMSIKSKVIFLKKVPPGTPISYGGTYTTRQESWIATLPLGYGDGYSRLLSGKARVLLRGNSYPVVGRICMDQMVVDLGRGDPGVSNGEEVVILGEQGPRRITAEEIAGWMGTINYEVTCAVSKRVPRVFFRHNKITGIRTLLGKVEFQQLSPGTYNYKL